MSGAKCRTSPAQTQTGRMRPFQLLAPKTVDQAVAAIQSQNGQAMLFAGGTDLVPMMKLGVLSTRILVSLSSISGLTYIREQSDGVHIGALTTIALLRSSELLRRRWPALHQSVRHFAAPQVRNMATLGGNIGRRSPCANTPPALMALSAKLTLVGPRGPHTIPIEQYFEKPDESVGELITEVIIPAPSPHSYSAFLELTRNSADLAKVNCAANITVRDGVCADARIVLGSVASRPIRASQVERELNGKPLQDVLIEDAARKVVDEIAPISDARSTADYRRHVSPVLVARTVKRAVDRSSDRPE